MFSLLKYKQKAYSPLGSGAELDGSIIPKHPTLAEIGAKHGKSAAQVALAFQSSRGIPTFPKSVKAERIAQNLDVDFKLSEDEMKAISALNADTRTGWGGPQVERNGKMEPRDMLHPHYPFQPDLAF